MAAYRYAFQMARTLHSPHMVFHTHQRVIQADERAQAREMCMDSIRELLDMAGQYGVRLLIETWISRKRAYPSLTRKLFWSCWNAFRKPAV